MKRKGGMFVLIGIFVLIGMVGVQYARQKKSSPDVAADAIPLNQEVDSLSETETVAVQRDPVARPRSADDEVELPLLDAVRDLMEEVGGEADDDVDLDELRGMLDGVEQPWRSAKSQMRRGILEANRKFRVVHPVPPPVVEVPQE